MRKPTFIVFIIFVVMMLTAAMYARPISAAYKEMFIEEAEIEVKYTLTFHNLSDRTVIFNLYHIDHGFTVRGPVVPAGGELGPGEYWSFKQVKGLYIVVWEKPQVEGPIKIIETFTLKENMDFYYP